MHSITNAVEHVELGVASLQERVFALLCKTNEIDNTLGIARSLLSELDDTVIHINHATEHSLAAALQTLKQELIHLLSAAEQGIRLILGQAGVLADEARQNMLNTATLLRKYDVNDPRAAVLNEALSEIEHVCSSLLIRSDQQLTDMKLIIARSSRVSSCFRED